MDLGPAREQPEPVLWADSARSGDLFFFGVFGGISIGSVGVARAQPGAGQYCNCPSGAQLPYNGVDVNCCNTCGVTTGECAGSAGTVAPGDPAAGAAAAAGEGLLNWLLTPPPAPTPEEQAKIDAELARQAEEERKQRAHDAAVRAEIERLAKEELEAYVRKVLALSELGRALLAELDALRAAIARARAGPTPRAYYKAHALKLGCNQAAAEAAVQLGCAARYAEVLSHQPGPSAGVPSTDVDIVNIARVDTLVINVFDGPACCSCQRTATDEGEPPPGEPPTPSKRDPRELVHDIVEALKEVPGALEKANELADKLADFKRQWLAKKTAQAAATAEHQTAKDAAQQAADQEARALKGIAEERKTISADRTKAKEEEKRKLTWDEVKKKQHQDFLDLLAKQDKANREAEAEAKKRRAEALERIKTEDKTQKTLEEQHQKDLAAADKREAELAAELDAKEKEIEELKRQAREQQTDLAESAGRQCFWTGRMRACKHGGARPVVRRSGRIVVCRGEPENVCRIQNKPMCPAGSHAPCSPHP